MMNQRARIVVTGASGQIAYSLLFRLASGEFLGPNTPIALHLYDIPQMKGPLDGVAMELYDAAFPLLKELVVTTQLDEAFNQIDYAFLLGSKPRGPGMERKDLLSENGKIFINQGKALNSYAREEAKVLVVGNPCNTNCLIALHHAPKLKKRNFHAMTRLDQNRAQAQLALKATCDITHVKPMIIWGNHSSTQVPDFYQTSIDGKPLLEVIKDISWLKNEFVSTVQQRGAAIIKARGKSSAASAASAALDAMKALVEPGSGESIFSSAVYSEGNPYGIDENLIFSFPCRYDDQGRYEIAAGFSWNEYLKEKIKETEAELIAERSAVKDLFN